MQILARIHYRVLPFQHRLYREVVLVKSFLLLVHLIFKYPVLQHLVLAQNRTIVHVSSNANGTGWCASLIGITSNGNLGGLVFNNGAVTISGPLISMSPVWTHVVETWSSTNGLRLYQNGVLVSSNSFATAYTASGLSNFITLGNSLDGMNVCSGAEAGHQSTGPFDGDIDDFRVYSRELTSVDINKIYNS